jgi:putative tricarboxylic transport membrane protein
MDGKGGRKETIIAFSLLGFSALYFVSSFRLEIGNMRNPGPGFLPIVIGFFLTVCTAIYLMRVIRKSAGERKSTAPAAGKNYRAISAIIASGILYPLILGTCKFLISTFGVTFLMLYLLKPRKLVSSFFLALAMAIVSFLTFSRLLGVGLPMGPIEVFFFNIGG